MLWCVVCACGARVGGGCGGVCCVHARACVRCVGGALGRLPSPLRAWFGGPVWCGGCVSCPPPLSRLCGSPPPLAGVCWWCVPLLSPLRVPSSFCLFSVSLGAVSCPGLPGCGVWGGGPCRRLGSLPLVFPRGGAGACTPRQGVTLLYGCRPWTCSVARYSSRSPHRGRVHCGSLGSPRVTGASLACPDGRCALPAAPRWARTAVRAVGSALGQAHWSPPQAGATAGR